MTDRLEEIRILLQKRIARSHGPTSSNVFNDSIDEIAHDLANFSDQWTNRLIPLTNTIPNGSDDTSVDAFLNGLDGRTLYVHHEATASANASYYNTTQGRPRTVYEQFIDVYQNVELLQEDLEGRIDDLITSASMVTILDTNSLYNSVNVEDALAEVMNRVNFLALGGLDLSAITQDYIPASDSIYDLGTLAKRIAEVHIGAGIYINSKGSDAGNPPTKEFHWGINPTTGQLELYDNTTVVARYSSDGVEFPQGGTEAAINDLTDVNIVGPVTDQVLKYDGANWVNSNDEGSEAAGSTGSIQFRDAAGELDGGLDLFWDIANTRLGIGTNSPSTRLHVSHPTDDVVAAYESGDTEALITFKGSATTGVGYVCIGAYGNNLRFYANGTQKATLTGTGRFGINHTTPLVSLYVDGKTDSNIASFLSDNSGAYISFQDNSTTSITHTRIGAWGNDLCLYAGNTERITIKSTGKIGIGINDPDESLHVVSGIKIGTTIQESAGTLRWNGTHFQGYDGADWVNLDVDIDIGLAAGEDKQIQFNDESDLAGASGLYWDKNSRYLGIGTENPDETLHIVSGIKIGLATQESAGTVQWDGTNFQGYNGEEWKNLDLVADHIALMELEDVIISLPVSGHYFFYNGNNWINHTLEGPYTKTDCFKIDSEVDGNLVISEYDGSGFTMLQFGGTDATYPALKRYGATLRVRKADDSDDTNLYVKNLDSTYGIFMSDPDNGFIAWQERCDIACPADGNIVFHNYNWDGFGMLQLGGTTSAFPALKRDSATLKARLADDSEDCDFSCSSLTTSASVGIGTDSVNNGVALEIDSSLGVLLMPRMTTSTRDALSAIDGMVIYNTTISGFQGRANGSWVNLH